jgi:hypothetical protein
MPTALRHCRLSALVALATLAGLLLAPTGASAGCEAMKSAGSCPPSLAGCCSRPAAVVDSPAMVTDLAPPEVDRASVLTGIEACPAAGACSCSDRPQAPAEPAPRPARVADDGRADRGESLTFELPEPHPSSSLLGPALSPDGRPPHVPIYLRNARFLT